MKIGTCVHLKEISEMEKIFATMQKQGFDNCQLICWELSRYTRETAQAILELTKTYGVEISAVWCGWSGPAEWNFYEGPLTLGLVPSAYREQRVRDLCRGSDFARMLGVDRVVSHMGFIPEDPNDAQFKPFCEAVKKVADHAKENGQYLMFETGQETPVTMLRCFETAGCDNLRVNLDTANVILYGKANPADALDVFGKWVAGVHMKDGLYPTNGHDLGHEVRIGDGKCDFGKVLRKLKALGYDEPLTIEREIGGEQQNVDILYARDYLQKILNEMAEEEK